MARATNPVFDKVRLLASSRSSIFSQLTQVLKRQAVIANSITDAEDIASAKEMADFGILKSDFDALKKLIVASGEFRQSEVDAIGDFPTL